jgi:hypothetical protein
MESGDSRADSELADSIMSTKSQNERPFQFSLRSLLLFSLAFALMMQYWRPLLELLDTHYGAAVWIIPPSALTIGFLAGRLLSCLVARGPVRNVVIAVSWIFLILASTAICYIAWCRYRWLNYPFLWYHTRRPRPFPDLLLIDYHNWLDVRRPVPPGTIKIHGEFYTVLLTLDVFSLAFFGLVGMLLGIVAPGLPRWLAARMTHTAKWLRGIWSRSGR